MTNLKNINEHKIYIKEEIQQINDLVEFIKNENDNINNLIQTKLEYLNKDKEEMKSLENINEDNILLNENNTRNNENNYSLCDIVYSLAIKIKMQFKLDSRYHMTLYHQNLKIFLLG